MVTPDFRNSKDEGGAFPAGLEDCYAALTWAASHARELGATCQLVVGGESGGGNLSIATALLSKVGLETTLIRGIGRLVIISVISNVILFISCRIGLFTSIITCSIF